MSGILSTLDIGKQALNVSQSQIAVTGNNIANADTAGYSRRVVNLEESTPLNSTPGQIGNGVDATEVARIFDEFIEAQYNTKLSDQQKWDALHTNLQNVEMLFNENQEGRLNDVMADFFKDWQDLSINPDDSNVRSAVIGDSQSLVETIGMLSDDLNRLEDQMDGFVTQEVQEVNELVRQIAELNNQIQINEKPGINANVSRDERALKVQELAQKLDINYIDNGGGKVTITTGSGQTLVDGDSYFELGVEGPRSKAYPSQSSGFAGEVYFSGSSSYEYSLQVVDAGSVDGATPPAEFRVSLDGGRSWLKNDDGTEMHIEASSYDSRVTLPGGDLELWFGDSNDSGTYTGGDLAAGDLFTVIPKTGVYWQGGDSMSVNITSQSYSNGQENTSRITGGTLGGYLSCRDEYVGGYEEKLYGFVKALTWEINSIHSSGAGLANFTSSTGTYGVSSNTEALGSAGSGLLFGDKLQAGNLSVNIYDSNTGALVGSPQVLDFDPGTAGSQNFDPSSDSLEDVRDALDGIEYLNADIQGGKLVLSAEPGYEFSFGTDSTGLLAALGVNTFLVGSDASTLALNATVADNLDFINAGKVDSQGNVSSGSNTTAQDIAALQYTGISFSTASGKTSTQTLQDYYTSLVSTIGSDTSRANFNLTYQQSLADDLKNRQDAIAGVNLDEEMSNLIKFQQSYSAAAKLITTANQMFDTLLSMKN